MDRFSERRAGILLHPTSLPGGELGDEAFRFVDFLVAGGQRVWQVLPLGPTHEDRSPYQCMSVHAGDPQLICLERLRRWGWLDAPPAGGRRQVLTAALAGFRQHADADQRAAFAAFRREHAGWLEDFALYRALHEEQQNRSWVDWPEPLRDREPAALAAAGERLAESIEQARFEQFVFFRQWRELREHANRHGILLFGDIPIFVAHDSAEVWAHREYFKLDPAGRPRVVAGVPPDYFSETGQRWGNPVYDWEALAAHDFAWWIERLRTQRELFDLIRLDHFRGFEAYWEIPGDAETAVDGHWEPAPGARFFSRLQEVFGELPLVAEDLGTITPEVVALRRQFGLPGMKILQFAFGGGADNPYLPHNHERLSVVYTGTHDNDTSLGWYRSADEALRAHVRDYLAIGDADMPWALIRAAYASVATLAVVPLQDVLELGSEHRMNTPGVTEGNWGWRFDWSMVGEDRAPRLRALAALYGR
ncbi:4-alpha-glucanotransferase [Thiohalobacter sp. IOR34]|uniref:4-alpha-glucanotransferase n=1 Tax=Thiohalobacter sp. IOR34 TaxID=3057176 RepID=UPI0025B278E9|nr:4-alpha-glucanotransferase [Thiohalobacter sp. IOR34]WJW74537.1 4-alpha-glucanotransferase [Thiohalobacter sp. IOR34]